MKQFDDFTLTLGFDLGKNLPLIDIRGSVRRYGTEGNRGI